MTSLLLIFVLTQMLVKTIENYVTGYNYVIKTILTIYVTNTTPPPSPHPLPPPPQKKKLGSVGSCTQKNEVFLRSKVENGNYPNVKWDGFTNYGRMQML